MHNSRSNLKFRVRAYVQTLDRDPGFSALLASRSNKEAITGNRMFDRSRAIDMIQNAAREAGDSLTANTPKGIVYEALVRVMRETSSRSPDPLLT